MPELQVKGAAFKQVLDTYREVRGDEFARQVLANVPGQGGEQLRLGAVLASSMHPVAWYRDLLRAGSDLSGRGAEFAHEIGRRSAERDIGTMHRLIFRALSTETLMKQVPRILGLYFDGGRGVADVQGPGNVRLTCTDFFGFDHLVWRDFAGGCEAMLAATRVSEAQARIIAGGTAERAVIELRYR